MSRDRRFHDEDELIEFLRRQAPCSRIGDDAALLPAGRLAVTMDTQLEGRHFLKGLEPALVARRSLAVNLSDLAAMGARPRFLFLALIAPRGFALETFFETILAGCEEHRIELSGGDLTRGSTLTVTITLAGELHPGASWLKRSAARAEQDLWLGGTIGEASLGLAIMERCDLAVARSERMPLELGIPPHLHAAACSAVSRYVGPMLQLSLGRWLASRGRSAAIDVSDGVAKDLHRLCRASSIGASIDLDRLPVESSTKELARLLGFDWRQLALAGGDDYVLLFSLDRGLSPPVELGARRIGRLLSERVVELVTSEGRARASTRRVGPPGLAS